MSKGILSKRGLKYTLSDSVYEQVMNIDQGTNILWNKLDTVVEYAEIFSDFCAFVSFVVLATVTELNWIEIVGYSLLAYLVGTVLSNCVWVFRGIILPILLFCFQLLTKYFLHFIIFIFSLNILYTIH